MSSVDKNIIEAPKKEGKIRRKSKALVIVILGTLGIAGIVMSELKAYFSTAVAGDYQMQITQQIIQIFY